MSANCHNCKHVKPNPGTHHVGCQHPVAQAAGVQIGMVFLSGKAQGINISDKTTGEDQFSILVNPHGVSRGWCSWPLDADPIWIEKCTGFDHDRRVLRKDHHHGEQ